MNKIYWITLAFLCALIPFLTGCSDSMTDTIEYDSSSEVADLPDGGSGRSIANSNLIQLPGTAGDIAVGKNGQAYKVGTGGGYGGYIYKWTGSAWSRIHGQATRVAVDQYGKPWVVNGVGDIFRGDGNGGWTHLPGKAQDIAIGGSDQVYMIGTGGGYGGTINKWNGSGWTSIHGLATRVAVDRYGKPWVVNGIGDIFYGDGYGGWTHIAGTASDVGVGNDGSIFVTPKTTNSLYRWNGSSWSIFENMSARPSNVSVGPDGKAWFTLENGLTYSYNSKQKTVVVSIHGASSGSNKLHGIVSDCAAAEGYILIDGGNWKKDSGDTKAHNSDAKRIRDRINDVAAKSGGKSNLKLIVVGKSSGGVLAWDTFKRHWGDIDDFKKVALVMIDPHGRVEDDGMSGAYDEYDDLWWISSWIKNTAYFRVYNIYQHHDNPSGASFPSSYVYHNQKLTSSSVDHDNIPDRSETKDMIRAAFRF